MLVLGLRAAADGVSAPRSRGKGSPADRQGDAEFFGEKVEYQHSIDEDHELGLGRKKQKCSGNRNIPQASRQTNKFDLIFNDLPEL